MWASDMRACTVLAAAFALAALPARAEAPLSAEAFDAYVTGFTITYQQEDLVFGIEEYLPDRRVRWSVAPGHCLYGIWYPDGEDICFVYEDNPNPHCWTFRMRGGRLAAEMDGAMPGSDLVETDRSTTPLPCPGPDVGV